MEFMDIKCLFWSKCDVMWHYWSQAVLLMSFCGWITDWWIPWFMIHFRELFCSCCSFMLFAAVTNSKEEEMLSALSAHITQPQKHIYWLNFIIKLTEFGCRDFVSYQKLQSFRDYWTRGATNVWLIWKQHRSIIGI